MFSVNTNPGAAVALQNLSSTNARLETIQNRISTGLEISSARDDGGIFAIAQRLRAQEAGLGVVQNSLDRGVSTVDIAVTAGESISDLLIELKAKALAASDASLDAASRDALNEDFTALRDQITSVVTNAEFNGANLIDNSIPGFSALANADGTSTISVQAEDLTLGGAVISLTASQQVNTVSAALAAVSIVDTSLDNLNAALARLGTSARSLEIFEVFATVLRDETTTGIGNLVDADLARESAALQAAQVKQQLGTQALAIANQAPQAILSFFQ